MMASGQSINDRLTAARYSIAGQGLAKSVCKATTEEVIGPKKKHLDYLLHCTNEPNVSIPQLANLLIERTGNTNWVVVFKALVTVHHLMCYGNERFTQYLASSNCSFQLGNFLDKSNVQGYDMSTFIRRYAKYLNEKALSYRTVAFDFCKIKRGKDDGILRTMNAEKLLKTLPVLQSQIDALLEFDCTANELTNGIINAAFMLLFRDLIRLFACYNDGIINLLEKYFDMNKKMCRDALDIYKKFLIRMDRVAEFLKVAENVGIDKGDIPDLAKAPSSLLDALEQHLASLEGKRGSGAGTPTQPTVKPANLSSVFTALNNTSTSFGNAAAVVSSGRNEMNGTPMEDSLKKIALEEEQAALNQHRERRLKELATQSPSGVPTGSATNPFLSSPLSQEPVIDLFGDALSSGTTITMTKTSDDLLCLKSNPFADSIINASSQPQMGASFQNDFWGSQNGFSTETTVSSQPTFASDNSFAAIFGNDSDNSGLSMPGLNLMPPESAPGFDAMGDVLQPTSSAPAVMGSGGGIPTKGSTTTTSGGKVITGDLDSSLSLLAQNLDINRGAGSMQKGGHVWNSPKNTTKTGGANWTPQIASATAAWNSPQHTYQAMGSTAPMAGKPADWSGGMMSGAFPHMTSAPLIQQQQQQSSFMAGGPRPMGSGPSMSGSMGMGMAPASLGMNAAPSQPSTFGGMPARPAATGFGSPLIGTQPQAQQPTLDPFGAL